MTDSQPPKATPAKRTAPKTTAAKAPAAKAPAAKAPAAKAPAAKTPATKTPAAKTPASKTPVAKAPAAAKPATTRARAPKATAAPAAPATVAPITPVEPVAASAVPAAAAAPAGWYPVSAGSATQRYWDGSAWTEHVHDPAAAAAASTPVAPNHREHLKAPEGTNSNTIWFWLTVGSMGISIAYWILTSIYWSALVNVNLDYEAAAANEWANPLFLISFLLGFVTVAAFIVFSILDWAQLTKRGVPKPFHWAWSLFALALSSPIVYVIGRTVVAKRRTGKGLAPLWVFVALQVVTWIVAIVAIVIFIVGIATGFLSLFYDAGEIL